jgi:hypothetical protein
MDSIKRGPRSRTLKTELSLDLVAVTHGSLATVLELDRASLQQGLPGIDFGMQVLERAISGLSEIQEGSADTLPMGVDRGVLLAWRDLGVLFEKGVGEVRFTLNQREKLLETCYSPNGFRRLQEAIQSPRINMRTIEGRLLMADFKEHGTRCRVHPPTGEPVLCLFDEDQQDEVLESILHYVRVVGEAREDPNTGKIASIKIADIRILEEHEDAQTDLLPLGTPVPQSFWRSPSMEELAESQDVAPLTALDELIGSWPGEVRDGFEDTIINLRQRNRAGGQRNGDRGHLG